MRLLEAVLDGLGPCGTIVVGMVAVAGIVVAIWGMSDEEDE